MLYKWADDRRLALVCARPLGAGDQGGQHALPRKFRILGSWRMPQIYRIAPNFGGAKFSRIYKFRRNNFRGWRVFYFSRSKFSRLEVDPQKTRKFILAPPKFGAILNPHWLDSYCIIIDLAPARRPYKCTRNYHSIILSLRVAVVKQP